MHWSLSEFLQLLEIRSQCWCRVDLAGAAGFRSPPNSAIYFYAVLQGTVTITPGIDQAITLGAGQVGLIISGHAHALRSQPGSPVDVIPFLADAEYADAPVAVSIGHGAPAAQVLCGRLKVRWPGGLSASAMPSIISLPAARSLVYMPGLVEVAKGAGASALLTKAAQLVITAALRDHPDCQMIFRDANFHDPIARAVQLIETHPFTEWTVGRLARKVGMGRSTFAARFLEKTGRPPMEMVTEYRMRLAVDLLTQTDLKVAEIGERVGYRSESAFNRRFAAFFDKTPGKLRVGRSVDSANLPEPAGEGSAAKRVLRAAAEEAGPAAVGGEER